MAQQSEDNVNAKENSIRPSTKQVIGREAERWLARNRSLVLRQTPFGRKAWQEL